MPFPSSSAVPWAWLEWNEGRSVGIGIEVKEKIHLQQEKKRNQITAAFKNVEFCNRQGGILAG
jgi:hypothetical protein